MVERDDILADLPAPTPEEPASLRQDIADELRDHLQSAAQRESLKTPDPEEVESRVLARFGNPQQIARKLWLEAMQEKLMLQKLTLAFVAVLTIAAVTACGLMWSLARDFQTTRNELLTQSREVNTELLAQLQALAHREPAAPNLMEWVPLKVQVLKNDEEQTPAEGFRVELYGHAISEAEEVVLREDTDESGMIDFGLVRPGSYTAFITTAWDEKHQRNILVKPGAPHLEKVLAPHGPPEEYPVKPVVQWPKELEGTQVAVLVRIRGADETQVGEHRWKPDSTEQYLLIRPDGRFATYSQVTEVEPEPDAEIYQSPLVTEVAQFHSEPEVFNDTFAWRGDVVSISELKVLRLPREAEFPGSGDSLVCLSRSIYVDRMADRTASFSRRAGSGVQLIERVPDDDLQIWNIEIDEQKSVTARSVLAMEQFPSIPNQYALIWAADFFKLDADRNMELSEEEASRWSEEFRNQFEGFPISYETFMKTLYEGLDEPSEKKS